MISGGLDSRLRQGFGAPAWRVGTRPQRKPRFTGRLALHLTSKVRNEKSPKPCEIVRTTPCRRCGFDADRRSRHISDADSLPVTTPFKDHFSAVAANCAQYRPRYPRELFDYLLQADVFTAFANGRNPVVVFREDADSAFNVFGAFRLNNQRQIIHLSCAGNDNRWDSEAILSQRADWVSAVTDATGRIDLIGVNENGAVWHARRPAKGAWGFPGFILDENTK